MINYLKNYYINSNPRYTIQIDKQFLKRNNVETNNNDEDSKLREKAYKYLKEN